MQHHKDDSGGGGGGGGGDVAGLKSRMFPRRGGWTDLGPAGPTRAAAVRDWEGAHARWRAGGGGVSGAGAVRAAAAGGDGDLLRVRRCVAAAAES